LNENIVIFIVQSVYFRIKKPYCILNFRERSVRVFDMADNAFSTIKINIYSFWKIISI